MQPSPQYGGDEPEYEGADLDKYKRLWREWVDVYGDARAQSFRDQEYYDGDVKGTGWGHWQNADLAVLKSRGQPPTVFNLIKRKVNAVAGVAQRTRAEPRALPRTPKDQKAAEIATDTLRYIKEQSRISTTSADGFMDALIAGYGACEIGGEEDHVPETYIDWRDFAFDPRSRRHDFSDASWLGVGKWLDIDVAQATYVPPEPETPQVAPQPLDPALLPQWAAYAQGVIAQYQQAVARRQAIIDILDQTAASGGRGGELCDLTDHPAEVFGDPQRKRVFIVDMWHLDPKHGWVRCVFTGAGKLFAEKASYVEKDHWGRKQKTHPIKAFSLYVSKDGWRYGEVRGMRSPQDEVNMRRSKALHLMTVRQLFYSPRAGIAEGNIDKMRKEFARPDGVIEAMDISQIRESSNLQLAAGQQQLGEEARQFLELEGPNPQLQGQQGSASSGRMLQMLQQAGLGQLGPIFERRDDWEDRRYRAMWQRAQQFWTAPMYVRVTDDKNAARFAAVNGAPMIMSDNGSEPPQAGIGHNGGPPMGPEDMMGAGMPPEGLAMGQGGPMPMMGGAMPSPGGGPMQAPQQQETGPILAELDMDIIIDRAPEAATLQAEQFETLSQLAQAGVLGQPGNPEIGRMIITASALPTKTQILDMLDKMARQPAKPNPMQVAQLKEMQAKIEKLVAERDKLRAETALTGAEMPKKQAETDLTAAKARTENQTATMNAVTSAEPYALDRYRPLGGSPLDPMAAASPPGEFGLPPQMANGPPPY